MPHLLGVLGGTFDPVHYGHLALAQEVQTALRLTVLHRVPATRRPGRPSPIASGAARAAMLEAAVFDYPVLSVDYRELWRRGFSSTIETLEQMQSEYPQRTLVLILSADSFIDLPTWYRWGDVFELAHVVIAEPPMSTCRRRC